MKLHPRLLRLATVALAITVLGVLIAFNSRDNSAFAAVPSDANSTNPCVASPAPAQWKKVIVLMFENRSYSDVIDSPSAPYITGLKNKCGTAFSGAYGAAAKNNWHDANYNVSGASVGSYNSKPNYGTLTSGLSPSAHGLVDNDYADVSGSDNIFNRLKLIGKETKSYYSSSASTTPCSSARFSGDYHDPMRFYTNLGGQSATTTTYCNTHDVPINPNFLNDLNSRTLPAFSIIIPKNSENMHDNSVASGDAWAQSFLDPIFNSAEYKSGETAVFFLWDEDMNGNIAVPNVLIAPSIVPGSKVSAPTGNPINHFSALRTWQEMLGVSPLLGDTGQATSLLSFYNGGGTTQPPTDNPPAVNITSPSGGTISTSPIAVSANATDDFGVTKVEFYDNTTLISTDSVAPYSVSWNTSTLSGTHSLTAKAFDTSGKSTTSSAVTVSIAITPSCPNDISANGNTAITTVNLPAQGTYTTWLRMRYPDQTNNSIFVKIDGNCAEIMGDSTSVPANTWTWVNYKSGNTGSVYSLNLNSGMHTVTMAKREGGVEIDRVLLLSGSCIPTDKGQNCTDTTPPSVSVTSPINNASVAGTINITANAADAESGISKVEFLVDGAVVNTDLTSPYSYSWNSSSVSYGSHTITARATDVAGNVTTSAGVVVNTSDTISPSAPTNLESTSVTHNSVSLSWNPSTDNVAVTSYRLVRNGTVVRSDITGTTYTDADSPTNQILENTDYNYTVYALDAKGNVSLASNVKLVHTLQAPDETAPTTPSGLTATNVTYNKVDLQWTGSTDNVGVLGYVVLRGTTVVGTTTGTTYSDPTVSPKTEYQYSIIARDAAGNNSTASDPITLTTPDVPDTDAPSAPVLLLSEASGPQVNLTWSPSTDNIGVAGYEIWKNGSKLPFTVTNPGFGDTNVSAGQTYEYYIVAFDAAGNKSTSNKPTITLTQASVPQTLTFTASEDATLNSTRPNTKIGKGNTLRADTVRDFMVKFNVTGINGRTVTSAKLQLWVTDATDVGVNMLPVSDNTWNEATVTWNTAPKAGINIVGSLPVTKRQNWLSGDMNNYIIRDGTYSLRFDLNSSNLATYHSRENNNPPKLILTVQ